MSRQGNLTRKLNLNSPDRKPSVFERLGTKSSAASTKNVCQSWAQSGKCPLNKQCKLAHTHVLVSPSKRSKPEAMKKSLVIHKKLKGDHKKSLKSLQNSDVEWEGWELGDLEDADEKTLEKRKQELQRELQLHFKKEKEPIKKKEKRNEKKRAASSSSSSTTTTESSSTTTTSSSSSSEPRKRPNRKRKHSSSSSESERSLHRQKKSQKTGKTKVVNNKRAFEKKDVRTLSDRKNKSVIIAKKTSMQKKNLSPNWEKPRGRSPIKQPTSKKSPRDSPDVVKTKSSSPQYDKMIVKNKNRGFSPKGKESSPKKNIKKAKDVNLNAKEKLKSPAKVQNSPSRSRKISSPRSRRHDGSSDKRRSHYEDQKHSPRRDRSREKDRKREIRRGRSNDNDCNGGLKKGGKILPLKPHSYSKDSGAKKESIHPKSFDKNSADQKSKEDSTDKDRKRLDREKNKVEKDKVKCERDKPKHKKVSDDHDRRSVRERDSDRSTVRNRNERIRERDTDRLRFAKDKEPERQKERDETMERCRDRQRERERIEKDRKEKGDKKHHREGPDNKIKDYGRELPSLLDLKSENPSRSISDACGSNSSDKHLVREGRRNLEKINSEKPSNQDRDGREVHTPDKHHDRRDSRRSDDPERKQLERDYDSRRNREEVRNSSEVRRSLGDGRRMNDNSNDSRRQWEDGRRSGDSVHDRRRLDSNADRRQHSLNRRPVEDLYRRNRGEAETDVRDFPTDERRTRRLMHNCSEWNTKDQNLEFKNPEGRDEWNHPDRHRDWNTRFEQKWMDREESRDSGWNHYSRRVPEEWNGEWHQDQPRPVYSEEECLEVLNNGFGVSDQKEKRHSDFDATALVETEKEKESVKQDEAVVSLQREKSIKGEGDALSDISDDPDDILNQDDEPTDENLLRGNNTKPSNHQLYINNDFLFDQRRPLLECLGERSLDFEEISDEELEEEARANKGIVDVLGADWAALLQDTRPKIKRSEGSSLGHRRWMIKKLIKNLGLSMKYAGEEFFNSLLKESTKVIGKGEESEELNSEKVRDDSNLDSKSASVKSPDNQTEEMDDSSIVHSVPSLHNAIMNDRSLKSVLFLSHVRFKRALSARADLSLRRTLCNLPFKEHLHFIPPLDNKMYEASIQQFQGHSTTAAV